jgi:hypothetical protein
MVRTQPQPNRPAITEHAAEKQLGIDHNLLRGLVQSGRIEGFERTVRRGHVTMIYIDQVETLREAIEHPVLG